MSQDISQWIAEIQAMREQVAQAQRDRDTALETATKWSELYNTEAEQRRKEAKLSQEMIEALKAEIQQLKAGITLKTDDSLDVAAISQEVEQLQTVTLLQQKLIEVTIEREQLIKALKAEQENHVNTRQSLTTALSDMVDLLTKHSGSDGETAPKPKSEEKQPEPTKLPESTKKPIQLPIKAKSPSLQLPPTRPAPPRS
jgi:predicted RNase H-like nuclease (RuvC/YqgF family)